MWMAHSYRWGAQENNPCRFGNGARIKCHNCHGARDWVPMTDPGATAPADQVDGLFADAFLELYERSIHVI
jgi:hypothetical protein